MSDYFLARTSCQATSGGCGFVPIFYSVAALLSNHFTARMNRIITVIVSDYLNVHTFQTLKTSEPFFKADSCTNIRL